MSSVEVWDPILDSRGSIGERDIAALARVLHACVHAGASVNYILPFTIEEAAAFWRDKVVPAVVAGERIVLLGRSAEGEIAGTVQLVLSTPPNQAHRVEIAKLLVHPDYRRRGLARELMLAAEEQARLAGRTLITLDTRTGDTAEPLYLSLGYQVAGVIPNYSRAPNSTELDAATFLFKTLV